MTCYLHSVLVHWDQVAYLEGLLPVLHAGKTETEALSCCCAFARSGLTVQTEEHSGRERRYGDQGLQVQGHFEAAGARLVIVYSSVPKQMKHPRLMTRWVQQRLMSGSGTMISHQI